MPREEATNEELAELAKDCPDEGLFAVQEILIGKFILWLRSFQCPDSLQTGTAYSMMNDVWESLEEFGLVS